ncbi:ATP-binding protein [Arhodomonas sp. AD133]|uniref:ATP-binding protein n=1 Tax=Arhodomonas sp. AD133 TaxID=3415009 RepID=UPI003EBDF860
MATALQRLWPQSLLGRLVLVMVTGVLATQLMASWLWAEQIREDARVAARNGAIQLARSMAGTVRFFADLPASYRPIVLEQLREMGSTRFFLTLNDSAVAVAGIAPSPLRDAALSGVEQTLAGALRGRYRFRVGFAMPAMLKVSPDGARLTDLPGSWTEAAVLREPAPVLAAQVELASGEWLLLASVMPDPYFLEKAEPLTRDRLALMLLPVVTVLVLALPVVRSITRPLEALSQAAGAFGKGFGHAPLPERGPEEYRRTRRAFVDMEQSIHRFIEDRNRLFSAISHDLRTPITRLKLRAEMLDDAVRRDEFQADLDELEQMVGGALQSVRETELDEAVETVQLDHLLGKLVRDARLCGGRVDADLRPVAYDCRPLALKRAVSNLLNNALDYGERAEVTLRRECEQVCIRIRDDGPGIPESAREALFRPWNRAQHGQRANRQGLGLGLGIARNLIHGLGGELSLDNAVGGGLVAEIRLPVARC